MIAATACGGGNNGGNNGTQPNLPPTTHYTINKDTITQGDSIRHTITGTDPDNTITLYLLDANADGTYEIQQTTPIDTTIQHNTPGTHTTKAQTQDQQGQKSTTQTQTIHIQQKTPTTTLEGTILLANPQPTKGLTTQPNIYIITTNTNTQKTDTTQTNQNGQYKLTNLNPGPHHIQIKDELNPNQTGNYYDIANPQHPLTTNLNPGPNTLPPQALWPHIELPDGQTQYSSNLEMWLDLSGRPDLTNLDVPQRPVKFFFDPDSLTYEENLQIAKQAILLANGTNQEYNHVTITENPNDFDKLARLTNGGIRNEADTIYIPLRARFTLESQKEFALKGGAHEVLHALFLIGHPEDQGIYCSEASPSCPQGIWTEVELGNLDVAFDIAEDPRLGTNYNTRLLTNN